MGLGDVRVPVYPARTADVDDIPRLAVLDSEIRRRGSDEFEGSGVVECDDRVPLLVCHLYPRQVRRGNSSVMEYTSIYLVDDAVPCEPGIVDDDMDLPISELCRFLHQRVDVRAVEHISRYGNCASARFVDLLGYRFRFICTSSMAVSDTYTRDILWGFRRLGGGWLTGINILHDDFGAFVCE